MRVVVVGGGVIGLTIAWRAARADHDVTVVDPAPGTGASWAAGGMLAPVTELHYGEEALLELNLAAAASYKEFATELARVSGIDVGYRELGTLTVARDADDNAALADLYEFQRGLGLDVQRLTSRECRALEPALAPSVRGGILARDDHQVDNRRVVDALLRACEIAGVDIVRARAVGAGADIVETDASTALHADAVVVASGAWAAELTGLAVRPVKGQILRLRATDSLLSHTVRGLDCYIVPRTGGEIVVGASVEEQGFDTTVTAGAVHDLLRAAYELVPGVTEVEFVEASTGLRPGTPDNAPIIGRTRAGLIAACGHYRNGILLPAVTADAVLDLLSGTQPDAPAALFTPERLEGVVHA